MSATLRIELATDPVERLAADAVVAFCFDDDRPLRGPAGRADWRLCGDLSRFVASHEAAEVLERGALLLPTAGRLRSPRLLLIGLGPAGDFTPDACAHAVRDAVARLVALRTGSAALGPPGSWLDRLPVGIGAQACLRGAVAALAEAGGTLQLRLVTSPEHVARFLRGLEAARDAVADRGVEIVLPDRERVPTAARPPAARPLRPPASGPAPPRVTPSPRAG